MSILEYLTITNCANSVNGTHAPNWEPLLEQPAYTPTRKLRVVVIGAGYGGLMVAYKIQHELKLEDDVDLTIYDRNADVGGTWFENTYPGAACDIPSHTYILPFEPNPDWSKFYAGQPEILAYLKRTADKYDLKKHMQLGTKVLETIWDEDSAQWKIKVEQNGEIKEDVTDVLINAAGFLNKWRMPEIEGISDFRGKIVHSAGWDNSYNWEGKKVAVIGNGASGIQLVAAMQAKVEKLVNYVRNPTYIAPNFIAEQATDLVNYEFTEEQKLKFRNDLKAFHEYRKSIEKAVNAFFFAMCADHPVQPIYEGAVRERMHSSLENAPELEQRITPTEFRAGCRRITPGDGYLEALQQSNCHDCWDRIERITETGIITESGAEEEFDLIICATGFDGSWHPQWKLTGRNGVTLEEKWKDYPEAFFATQVADLPNYFMVTGPNTPISHGSVTMQMSWVVDYMLRWVKRIAHEDIKTIAPKQEAVDDFNEYSQEFLKRTVWAGDCRAFYKNGRRTGHVNGVYAGSMMHFKNGLERASNGGEHFHITWRSKNRFRCLGNGTAQSDEGGAGDLAPYFDEYP